jgi:hypothetical protein
MNDNIEKEKPLSLEEAVELLEPDAIEEVDTGSLDPLGLSALATRVARRLVSTGGRPTDKSWTVAKRVPMKESTWAKLEQVSEQSGRRGLRVAPGQLAAIALETGLERLVRMSTQTCGSMESWEAGDYEFQDESEEEAKDLVGAITCGGLW